MLESNSEIAFKQAVQVIIDHGKQILDSQGHIASGALKESFEGIIKKDAFEFWGNHYGLAQETGIRPENVKAGRLYIEAITEWVKNKGFESDAKKARGIAFAIGKVHSAKGMHTVNSVFAPQKQGWLSTTIKDTEQRVDELIFEGIGKDIEKVIDLAIDEAKRNLGNQIA